MHCIDNRLTDVYFNLAAEEYLLKHTDKNVFMLWQSEPAVVIGRHQELFDEVNTTFADEKQIKIARRFSGGGAVFHDLGNLNLTFIETNATVDFDVYSQRMIDMLASLGIKATVDERRGLHIDGLKISGSAQSIYKDRVLFHATLLFSSDLEHLNGSLAGNPNGIITRPKRKIAVKSVKSPVTNISNHLPSSFSLEDFKNHIISYYTNSEIQNQSYFFSSDDLSQIEQLRHSKYATESWIFDGKILKK